MFTATKGFVSRHVLVPRKSVVAGQPDLLSWTDPPPKYSEKPSSNELLSLLDPLSAATNQVLSPADGRSGSAVDLQSAGIVDNDVFLHPHVSFAG